MAHQLKENDDEVEVVIMIDSYFVTKEEIEKGDIQNFLLNSNIDLNSDAGKYFLYYLEYQKQLLIKYHFPSYSGRVVLLKAKPSNLYDMGPYKYTLHNGWKKILGDTLEIYLIDGEHDYIFTEANVKNVADRIW